MSSRTPIQVPEELKVNIDEMKGEFRAKTHYEVIEKLIASHKSFQQYRQQQVQKWQEENERQEREDISIGEASKQRFDEFKKEMGFKNDESVFEFLLHHFESSAAIDKTTFQLYRKLR